MEQNLAASLYFSKDRILLAVIERTDTAFNLHYINSFSHVDLNDINTEDAALAIFEIGGELENFSGQIGNTFVTLDSAYYIMTTIPGNVDIYSSEFSDLINLEVRQHNPDDSIDNYRIKVTPLINSGATNMNLVTIVSKSVVFAADAFVQNFALTLTDINPVPFSSINSYRYSYPDNANSYCILVNVLDNVVDFYILCNNDIAGIEYSSINSESQISDVIESKINIIINTYKIDILSSVYFYGDTLNKEQYLGCWEVGMVVSADSRRLNPFRMMKTQIEPREQEYCSRVFHQFVPCIGGAIPIQFPITII